MLHSAQTSVSYKSDYRLNFGSGFHQRKMVLNNACLAVKKTIQCNVKSDPLCWAYRDFVGTLSSSL